MRPQVRTDGRNSAVSSTLEAEKRQRLAPELMHFLLGDRFCGRQAENLIKQANNDAGLAAHPSSRWSTNCVHFQLVMLAYNLNCWLMLSHREEGMKVEKMKHTMLATTRLRFLFLAAHIWRHAGREGISYSDHYQEEGVFQRLLKRLRAIVLGPENFLPVLATPLSG